LKEIPVEDVIHACSELLADLKLSTATTLVTSLASLS